jgi:hypothetical protein
MAANLNRRPNGVGGGSGGRTSNSIVNGGANRSYNQLPASSAGSGTAPRGVRFESDEDARHPLADIGESFLDWFADIFYALVAIQCALGVITIVVLLYLIVRPFSVSVYRRLANQLGIGSFLEAIALLLPSTKICLTGDSDVPSPVGTSILVSNHVVDADWYHHLMLGRCVGLRGSIKVFLRNEILHLNKQDNPAKGIQRGGPRRRNSPPSPPRNGSNGGPSTTIMQETYSHGNGNSFSRNALISGHHSGNGNAAAAATTAASGASVRDHHPTSPDLALMAKFLHSFLEFPLIDEEDYISDRESLFQLLRSFADRSGATSGSSAPVHFLLFPEGWSLYNGQDRRAVLARSNEFAKREGRPQLKHLLLPRTTGFNASISSLRESSPVIYDVTIAYRGYDGSVPQKVDMSIFALWGILRRRGPEEIHIRMKRYSMEEVLQDASWLDKKWAEKDRMLDHFSRHHSFPVDSRGFCRHQLFETRFQSIETSVVSLFRLLLLPCAVPVLLFLSIPIVWTTFMVWLIYKGYQYAFPDPNDPMTSSNTGDGVGTEQAPGSASQAGTPFIPATPFASPSIANWRDMLLNNSGK